MTLSLFPRGTSIRGQPARLSIYRGKVRQSTQHGLSQRCGLQREFRFNPDSASVVEQAQIKAFFRALFHIWSNTYYQNLNGTIDPQIFEGMVSEVSTYARAGSRSVFWAWESERFIYPAAFRSFMDSISATAASEPNVELLDSIGR